MSSAKLMWSIVLVIVLSAIAAGLYSAFGSGNWMNNPAAITNFEECAAAGNPVMESYPRQCRSSDGRLFVEEVPAGGAPVQNPNQPYVAEGCAIGGCSSQICGEAGEAENMITTCEYRAEYACYQSARCERQAGGKCGWTQTEELKACIANAGEVGAELDVPTDIVVY